MYKAGLLIFILLWVIWLAPFVTRRRGGGQRAAVTAPAARWGIVLEGIGMGVAWFHNPYWPQPSTLRIIVCLLIALFACVISWTAVSALGKQWRFDAALGSEHDLVESGPYAFVRHPIYASMLLMLVATGLMMSNWIGLLIALVLYIVGTEIRVHVEERLLSSRFGDQFERYRRRVSAYLPGLR